MQCSSEPKAVNKAETCFHVIPQPFWKIVSLLLYIFDLGTDIYSAFQYFSNEDYWWGSLTATFAFLPMGFSSNFVIMYDIQTSKRSRREKWMLVLGTIVCTPIVPFGILVRDVVNSFSTHTSDDNVLTDDIANSRAKFVKLYEGLCESYPQAGLQIYIVFKILNEMNKVIMWWQYVTIAMSLITLSFALSNSVLFITAANRSKVTFFFFGLLGVASRIMVCCLYSLIHKALVIVPIGTAFVATSITWSIIRWRPFSMCGPLYKYPNHCTDIVDSVRIVMGWFLTCMFNSFTVSGLVITTSNLVFAVVGCFMDVPQAIAITTLIISTINWIINIILALVPCFEGIRKDFLVVLNGESEFY
ncbi:unnamed protein product [Meganyctiphanes norvegica]|uniref:XK-related protein n=1 Tax=Meganyctiphanes norvegica TaxID=48144 RepID=A0AAV2QYB7_MEGNR